MLPYSSTTDKNISRIPLLPAIIPIVHSPYLQHIRHYSPSNDSYYDQYAGIFENYKSSFKDDSPSVEFKVERESEHPSNIDKPLPSQTPDRVINPTISATPSTNATNYTNSTTTPTLTHWSPDTGARMVDISHKSPTLRTARAQGHVLICPAVYDLLKGSTGAGKGDALTVAQVAGVQAAKLTSRLIPLCHQVALTSCRVRLHLRRDRVLVAATVECVGLTGVEMEALTAVSVAALTVYDMVKSASKGMSIEAIRLVEKTGGKSDYHDESLWFLDFSSLIYYIYKL